MIGRGGVLAASARMGLLALCLVLGAHAGSAATPEAKARTNIEIAGAPNRGPTTAPVTLVEFGDFYCPHCRKMAAVIDELVQRHPEQLRHVYKFLPNPHGDAGRAAIAAAAADLQGGFWKLRPFLYSAGTSGLPLQEEALRAAVAELGLDADRFSRDLRAPAAEQRVMADLVEGDRLGLEATPEFFINGRRLTGAQPIEVFERIIAEELAATR